MFFWLFAFNRETPADSPIEHVIITDGSSFDDGFRRARAAGWVPEGQWDCVGAKLPPRFDTTARSVLGQSLDLETAEHHFGERVTWDWRVQPKRDEPFGLHE